LKIAQTKKRSSKLGDTQKSLSFILRSSSADPVKLRFENSTNKKTLKQAWRFL